MGRRYQAICPMEPCGKRTLFGRARMRGAVGSGGPRAGWFWTRAGWALSLASGSRWETRSVVQQLEQSLAAQRRAHERTERAIASKDRFLANISHELRTPLASLLGYLDWLGQDGLPGAQRRHFASRGRRAATDLLSLLGQILEAADGPDSGGESVCSVDDLLRRLEAQWSDRVRISGLEWRCVGWGSGVLVKGCDRALTRLMGHLLDNAIRFAGGGTITLGATQSGDHEWTLWRQDEGPGVPPAFVDRMFEAFAQADESMSRKRSGAGLGLHIAQELARSQGTAIQYSRCVPSGARFGVPLQKALRDPSEMRDNERGLEDEVGPGPFASIRMEPVR